MTERYLALITAEPIDRARAEAFVLSRRDGALVVFEGVVRDHDHGEQVRALDYEAHPQAEEFLAEVCRGVSAESGLSVAAIHRVGALAIGDVALVAAVASPHRADAFAVCGRLVDLVKERTPIWKRQHLADGPSEWVGL